MLKGLIFDFDGLILDTEVPAFQTWSEIYQAHGVELPISKWAAAIGSGFDAFNPMDFLELSIQKMIDREKIRLFHEQRSFELLQHQVVLPGVTELINDAHRFGLKLAVASSSSREWVVGHLERLGLLAKFDCVRTADEVSRVKPEPDLYLSALHCLGLTADEAIAFEDSPNGVTAAQLAGLCCVAVPNQVTSQMSLDHADLIVPSLANLPLKKLLAEYPRLAEKTQNGQNHGSDLN